MSVLLSILLGFCLISGLITYSLGIYVYLKNSRATLNRLFFLTMLTATYWAFCEFMIWQSGSQEMVRFWLKASSLWPFVIAFSIHFILDLTNHPMVKEKKILLPFFLYLPTAIISMVLFFTDSIYTTGYTRGIGYTYMAVRDSLAYQIEVTYFLAMMIFAAITIFTYYLHARTEKIKKQAWLVGAGLTSVIIFGLLSGVVLPALGIIIPNLVFMGILLFSFIIAFAILRHRLFILSPETAVPDILRTMPDGMVLLTIRGAIISANESAVRILGINLENSQEYRGENNFPTYLFDRISAAIMGRDGFSDMELIPPWDEGKTLSIAGSLVRNPDGDPEGIVLILRDITDRKAAERALRLANEKISLLIRLTRHDVNNLVSALSGYLLLIRENPSDPETDRFLSTSISIAERIHDHLQFTREYQDVGSQKPHWQPLESVVTRAIQDLLLPDRITITKDIPPVEVFADPLLVKVIENLLDNAIRHGDTITMIRLSASTKENAILIVVIEDDGVGIPDMEKGQIFKYGIGKNTGLGLAISRDILSLTGISIIETGRAGTGARFEIHFPSAGWRTIPQNR